MSAGIAALRLRGPLRHPAAPGVGAFLIAVTAALLSWLALPPNFHGYANSQYVAYDYINYYEPTARNILAGHGFVMPGDGPAVRYPPGYPLLLAGVFGAAHSLGISEEVAYAGFVLLCLGLSAVFIFLIARSVWGVAGGLISSLVWSTYPFMLWLAREPKVEIPFSLFLYAAFYLFLRATLRPWGVRAQALCFAAGLLLGAAMLTRPIAIALCPVLIVGMWLVKRGTAVRLRLLLSALLLLGSLAAIAPWEVWAYTMTGQIIPLSTGGVPSIVDGLTFAVTPKSYRQETSVPANVADLMRGIAAHNKPGETGEIRSYGALLPVLLEEGQKRPLALAELVGIKAARSLYATDSGRLENVIAPIQLVYVALALASGVAAWKQQGLARGLAVYIGLSALYFWVMSIAALSILRYMIPVIGLSFACCGALLPRRKLAAVSD